MFWRLLFNVVAYAASIDPLRFLPETSKVKKYSVLVVIVGIFAYALVTISTEVDLSLLKKDLTQEQRKNVSCKSELSTAHLMLAYVKQTQPKAYDAAFLLARDQKGIQASVRKDIASLHEEEAGNAD